MLNNIKILFIDLDGTLIYRKKISKKNIEACKKLQDAGVKIVITTGRDLSSSWHFVEILNINKKDGYIICLNGAKIYSLEDKKPVFLSKIPNENSKKLIDFLRKEKWNIGVYKINEMFVKKINFITLRIQAHLQTKIKIAKSDLDLTNECFKIFCYRKSAIFFPKVTEQKVNSVFNSFNNDFEITKTGSFSLEIVNKNISKGEAVKYMSKLLNIELKKVAVMGDSYNDVSMFKIAGISFAMKNSIYEISKIATNLTLSNKNSGVAYAINNIIFK